MTKRRGESEEGGDGGVDEGEWKGDGGEERWVEGEDGGGEKWTRAKRWGEGESMVGGRELESGER